MTTKATKGYVSKGVGSVRAGGTTGRGSRKTAAKILSAKGRTTQGAVGVGRGRGVLGGGTPDPFGRLPSPRRAAGNYGGGYARKNGSIPANAKRRG